jgi:hypothetical protein
MWLQISREIGFTPLRFGVESRALAFSGRVGTNAGASLGIARIAAKNSVML